MTETATQLALPSGERGADASVTVYGIAAVGISAVIVVGSLFGAWLSIRSGTQPWPPSATHLQNYFGTTLSLTAVIGTLAGWWALYAVRRDERRQAVMALAWAVFMQGAMINLITYTVRSSGLSARTNTYGVLYYALNVAVAAVFATGMGVAGVALARTMGGQVTSRQPAVAWAAAWYGTFVSAAWFVMYAIVYIVK